VTDGERIELARRAGFYPLVLLLERLRDAPVSDGDPGLEERVRFRHAPDLAFSAGDVVAVEDRLLPRPADDLTPDRKVREVTTTFLGLTGCVSPLPSYLTEELLQDDSENPPVRDFLDIFHHRILTLLYRSQARTDLPNSRRSDCTDVWSHRLLLLLGFDAEGPWRGELPPWQLLRLAGLLADGEVTARTLELALVDLLGADLGDASVSVEQFVGTWVEIDPSQLTRLGRASSQLGRDLLLGRRVFDRAGKFRITIGPLTRADYARFAPTTRAESGEPHPLRRVEQVLSTVLTGALEHEIVLWLRSEAAPSFQLSSAGRTRLGHDSWLGGQSRESRITVPHAASKELPCASNPRLSSAA